VKRSKRAQTATTTKSDVAEPLSLEDFSAVAYAELRRIAGSLFKQERVDHTLQPTALVHEVYIRLTRQGPPTYENRAHFFSTAARAMRQILVDYARAHNADKRGGPGPRPSLSADVQAPNPPDYPAIDSALKQLTIKKPQAAQIAELRIFVGLSSQETAEVLGMASSTVRAHWAVARAFLEKQLENS
jgi:RNA polymerase sigma factor (TIGR02999 family)